MLALMQSPALWLGFALLLAPPLSAQPTAGAASGYQRLTLDQFMREALVTQVPISFEIPESFAAVDLPKRRPPTATWIERRYHEETLRTGRMPRSAAQFRGSLSFTVVFDSSTGRFLCGKMSCEMSLRDDLARAGLRVTEYEKRQVGGLPVLLLAMDPVVPEEGAASRVYQAYLPLRAGSGVVHLVYRPAPGGQLEGESVWKRFRESLATPVSTPPTRPAAPPTP